MPATDFEFLSYFYNKKWITIEQIRLMTFFNKITPEEYKTITSEDYPGNDRIDPNTGNILEEGEEQPELDLGFVM